MVRYATGRFGLSLDIETASWDERNESSSDDDPRGFLQSTDRRDRHFLFNSFSGDALSAVQAQIRDSLDESLRKLTPIYMNPRRDRDAFTDCDWLFQKRELPTGLRDEMRLVVYESKCANRGDGVDGVFVFPVGVNPTRRSSRT